MFTCCISADQVVFVTSGMSYFYYEWLDQHKNYLYFDYYTSHGLVNKFFLHDRVAVSL